MYIYNIYTLYSIYNTLYILRAIEIRVQTSSADIEIRVHPSVTPSNSRFMLVLLKDQRLKDLGAVKLCT